MNEIGTAMATIEKVATLVDGSLRVTLDISAEDVAVGAELLKMKIQGRELIQLGIVEVTNGQAH